MSRIHDASRASQSINLRQRIMNNLAHPVWWEDIIPTTMQAAPKLLARLGPFLATGILALETQVTVWLPVLIGAVVNALYSTTEHVSAALGP